MINVTSHLPEIINGKENAPTCPSQIAEET